MFRLHFKDTLYKDSPITALKKIAHNELIACYAELYSNKKTISSMDELEQLKILSNQNYNEDDRTIYVELTSLWEDIKEKSVDESVHHLLCQYERCTTSAGPGYHDEIRLTIASYLKNILTQMAKQNLCSKEPASLINDFFYPAAETTIDMPVSLEKEPPTRTYCRLG